MDRDAKLGFQTLFMHEIVDENMSPRAISHWIIEKMAKRGVDDSTPVYLSIDIDVLDPAFSPGTGTPCAGGFQTRELLSVLQHLQGKMLFVGGDLMEVAPCYDHGIRLLI